MADSQLSGYKAAATEVEFNGTRTLDSLADNEYTHLSDEIDNTTNLYMFDDLEWVSTSQAHTGGTIEIYLIPEMDGSNYPDWAGDDTTTDPKNTQYRVASIILNNTEAQRVVYRNVSLPNGPYKYGVRNSTGLVLPASGSTLKRRPHQYQG